MSANRIFLRAGKRLLAPAERLLLGLVYDACVRISLAPVQQDIGLGAFALVRANDATFVDACIAARAAGPEAFLDFLRQQARSRESE